MLIFYSILPIYRLTEQNENSGFNVSFLNRGRYLLYSQTRGGTVISTCHPNTAHWICQQLEDDYKV